MTIAIIPQPAGEFPRAPLTDKQTQDDVVTNLNACATAINSGIGGSRTVFKYTATGAEDPDGFPVLLPSMRADTNYVAQASGGGLTNIVGFDCPVSGYTTTQITVASSGELILGDVIIIEVQELT